MIFKIKNKFCKHSRTFEHYPEEVFWSRDGEVQGRHTEVRIYGCLDCGVVFCEDYGE